MAHLIHWATQIAFGLGAQVTPPVYMAEERQRREAASDRSRPAGEEPNALAVTHYRDIPLDQVLEELMVLIDGVVERACLRGDEQMNATDAIPYAGQRPLWQQIGGETFLHWPQHAEAMERATKRV